MSELNRYRRDRSQTTGVQQVVLAVLALAAVAGLVLVLWQVADIFAVLGAHLPPMDDGARPG